MVTSVLGLPLFPWTPTKAYALGDVNFENFRYLNHFLETDRARSVRAYDRIQQRIQGIPWVNSIAADRKGRAYYSMDGAIPNVPDEKATNCAGALGAAVFPLTGIPILDGSRSACGWDTDADAVVPGIFGPAAIPRLFRRDYVENGNDSHWLSNPERAADRIRPGDRRRGDDALAAHAPRAEDDRAAARRHRRALRQGVHAAQAGEGRARQPPVRGRAVARRAGRLLRAEPEPERQLRPRRRQRRVPGARRLGRARRPRLAGRDPLPSLRLPPARQLHLAADRRLERLRPGVGGGLRRPVLRRRSRSTRRAG